MDELEDRQQNIIKQWLNTIIGENDSGPISVRERIAYLVVCNGGYRSTEKSLKLAGTVIGPFTLGLSLPETVEHAYYIGMLSGIGILCEIDPYDILDLYIEEYIARELAEFGMEIDTSNIMNKDGAVDIEKLLGSYNHMNPKHGGYNN